MSTRKDHSFARRMLCVFMEASYREQFCCVVFRERERPQLELMYVVCINRFEITYVCCVVTVSVWAV